MGIRELKARLSEYIRKVRAGERVLVTDRGEIVAELRSPASLHEEVGNEPGFDELVRKGLVSIGAPNDPEAYPDLEALVEDGEGARLLDEERGS